MTDETALKLWWFIGLMIAMLGIAVIVRGPLYLVGTDTQTAGTIIIGAGVLVLAFSALLARRYE